MISAQNLRGLNRVLTIAEELQASTGGPLRSSVVLACKQSTFRGGFQDHEADVDSALRLGLLVLRADSCLQVTDVGLQFLSLNPARYYELQALQAPFLFRLVVEEGPLKMHVSDLALLLERDQVSGTLNLRATRLKSSPRDASACFNVLLFLGVFEQDGDLWRVRPTYLRQMSRLREVGRTGESELRAILEEQAALGRAAEVVTVEYERQRLRALGGKAEALLVSRIGEIDVGAGYDVESFNGQSGTLQPDRFIEVKASTQARMRFFWTRNEYETARRLGPAYFLYFVGSFRPERGLSDFSPRIIQDPAATLPSLPHVHIEPRVYLVTEDVTAVGKVDIQALELDSPIWGG